ncbi:MAG: MaoC family dehydratase N-terminal domain-containing protein [Lachnospiraceae bacterium]|nr:MaoC family dehydratase N-terminal domain-containing protein [Lachnospiraceae bacterium]
MNSYSYEDIYVGMKESFTVTVTESMMDSFRGITGDINPLHTDEAFAKEKGFDRKVVYGLLTSSLLSTLAGVYLPGERSLIREVEVKLPKPVYVGDVLEVTGEVSEKQDAFNAFEMKVKIVNDRGEKVLRGKMKMSVLQ